MADFWIKLEKGTPDKPEILEISSILGVDDPDTVMGKLIRVWSWFDSNSENGHAPSVTNVLIDRMTGVKGFTDALVTVGWMKKTDAGYYMSNFDRHIGKGAKKRASDAERKRKSRECHAKSVTEDETEVGLDKSREDKSREDNNIPPKPATVNKKPNKKTKLDFSSWPQIPDDSKLSDLIALRKSKKAALSQTVVSGLSKTMHELNSMGIPVNQVLEIWCLRGWQGLKKDWVIEHVKKEDPSYGQNRHRANDKPSLSSKALSDRDRLQAAIDAHRKGESVLVVDDSTVSTQVGTGRGGSL